MKCQAVRPALSLLVDGQLALTEWAVVQTHLRGCSECREELDRLQAKALARARAKRRRATVATLAGAAVILGAAGGGFYIYQGQPRPSARSKALVQPVPRATAPPAAPVADPAPRATRPAATEEGIVGDRMPTQARPSTVLSAPPDAEAMPTQGLMGSRPRGR
ncbi:MAG: zf-HC2 domain-containing protein [Candidatus Rokuibacteriota bacterium]